MKRFVAGEDAVGKRLDSWLSAAAGLTRSEVEILVKGGSVIVGGRPVTKAHKLRPGDVVEIEKVSSEAPPGPSTPEVSIKFEDDELAVVSKPAGLVVHGGSRSLVDVLATRMSLAPAGGAERPGIIHRLDKYTSGLLIVAKSDRAFEALSRQMRHRAIVRTYLAVVSGVFTMTTGRIEAPVSRSEASPTRMKISSGGREAVTEFRVLETFSSSTLVEVGLVTGRTHQIRVHFSHIKHPVVGDEVYGPRTLNLATRLSLNRPFLHAVKLRFNHPLNGEDVVVQDELARDLAGALERLRESG